MSKRKPPDERLAKIEKQISQLKAREQRIKAELNQQERKARTRRLIQIGAIFETGFEISSTAEAEYLARELRCATRLNGCWLKTNKNQTAVRSIDSVQSDFSMLRFHGVNDHFIL
ncbi:hypothetical protein UY416_25465 [Paenibacillus polymyxa]|uniref:hypothetical protein n=1 Tax=Paenibacillus polymyxa TaxID=1406 RepID=UPI002AB5A8AE|nr:hypothetical protein [Paenibacillus polymyxa]MDY8049642.1 hypothetical protein [Paenibacillus polymyxa]